ncbi:MAG: Type restriction enzyme res subunit [Chthoniobacteraceae bacterium]|nr:Type restriction enzyme res subunit [Chthoniobacteraceae bacterium]
MIDLSPQFNPAQQLVMDHALLDSGFSCVLQMPTGSGKTWMAREAIRRSVQCGFRAVYLSPLRALADELSSRWADEFRGTPVGVFTGDYGGTRKSHPVSYQDAQVLIMTPERLDACTRCWRGHWSWIPEVDWLVVDEIHLLGNRGRGARLEGAISRFRRLNPFCRVLALSATLGNREELADWLEGIEFQSDWRPVSLKWRIVHFRKAAEKPGLLAQELARTRDAGGQSLVFVQSRRRSEQLAAFLREQGLDALHHHAGLDHSRRRVVENAFRESSTRILVATGTLEMGLNLPVRQVVLYDTQGFDGTDFVPLAVNTVWQRAGRAGRPGLDPVGEALLIAPSWNSSAEHYPRGRFERIRSGLRDPQSLAEQILAEVHSGMARSSTQLHRVFDGSLAKLQGDRLPIDECIGEMLRAGMLAEDEQEQVNEGEERLRATPLGRIAIRHLLRPATILDLRRFLCSVTYFTHFDLLVAAACADDCEPVLSVDFEELDSLVERLKTIDSFLFEGPRETWHRRLPRHGKRLLSALKTAVVLLDWSRTGDLESVANEHCCYPFEILRLIESMDRLLMAAATIHKLSHRTDTAAPDCSVEPDYQDPGIGVLRQMIINGVNEPAAKLTLIDGIGAKWARKLVAAGITDLSSLAVSHPSWISTLGGVSEKRATTWVESAKSLATLNVRPYEHLLPSPIPVVPADFESGTDPYRLRRALELNVQAVESGVWAVSGGLEPHRVQGMRPDFTCDCQDHAKGNVCKHVLAVRLQCGDDSLQLPVQRLEKGASDEHLDLFYLWFERN